MATKPHRNVTSTMGTEPAGRKRPERIFRVVRKKTREAREVKLIP